jgi:FixJ family two-component response regulator
MSSCSTKLTRRLPIVDDDQFLLESLHDFFDAMGIASKTYPLPIISLPLATFQNIHCVLADLKMPGTSGLELLERLVRENGPPVCLMTSFADERTRRAAERGGAIGFLEKPVRPADLLALISTSARSIVATSRR